MSVFEKVIDICNDFKAEKYSVNDFQQWLETVLLPDDCKHTLEVRIKNSVDELERIIFTYPLETQRTQANAIANDLIQAVLLEREKNISGRA